nr:response regulator transcription factor [Clostridiales bacterium]
EKNNYSVDTVSDGREALDWIEAGNYDAAIFDVMMPVMDGMTALRKLRAKGDRTPVLLLTAKSEIDDKVEGLDSGANDYLTKPFDMKELLARIRAMTRGGSSSPDTKLSYGNITLDLASYELSSPNGSYKLAGREFQMMEMLLRQPKTIVSPERMMDHIWGYDSESDISIVWVYISYLRKKLTALGSTVAIKASRGAGYSLEITENKQ